MSAQQGRILAEHGMQLALFSKSEWKEGALAAITRLANAGAPFTADDVIAQVGLPGAGGMNQSNAVGAALSGAARRKQIVRVGFRPASRTASHARMLSVWKGSDANSEREG